MLIRNRTGLPARPAVEFVECANRFKSKITIKKVNEENDVNAKSIMFLLSLGLGQGDEVEISAIGEDEVDTVDTLIAVIESKFDEE